MKPSKEKRLRLLQIVAKSQQSGAFPLVREIAEQLGYRGESSITRMLDSLVSEGYLQKHGGGRERRPRIYRLTPQAEQLLPQLLPNAMAYLEMPVERPTAVAVGLPVLGTIPAGPWEEAIQECEERVEPGEYLRVQQDDFFLRIKGKSMTGDGILPGDLVLIRPGVQVNNGEIAAVQIHRARQSDSTLKHIHFQPGKKIVRLRASNPAYGEVVLPADEVNVVGAYRGLMRLGQPSK